MIRTSRAHLHIEAHTHQGMTGKNNEDRYGVASFRVSEKDRTPVVFAVLADGIGGHKGGEVAAELAVNTIYGAGKMRVETGTSPVDLRAAVTTPAGTTAAGLAALEDHGLRAAFSAAVGAATQRSAEIGRG